MKMAQFSKDHAYRLCSSKYNKNIMQDPGQVGSSIDGSSMATDMLGLERPRFCGVR